MNAPRFNAEDVRQKALLKATADTYGGTLPLPRRPRRPVAAHSSGVSQGRPMTSTPVGTLPRSHHSRSSGTGSADTSSFSGSNNTPTADSSSYHRLQQFNNESLLSRYKGNQSSGFSSPSSNTHHHQQHHHLAASCSTLSPRSTSTAGGPRSCSSSTTQSPLTVHSSALNASCRRLYQEKVRAWRQIKLDNPASSTAAPPPAVEGEGQGPDSADQRRPVNEESKSSASLTPRHASLDLCVNNLRSEMINLIDQDLSLLQRLLTLNERIDDLKCGARIASECSCTQQHSFYSTDDFYDDFYADNDADIAGDIDTYSGKYPSPSSLSLFQEPESAPSSAAPALAAPTLATPTCSAMSGSVCSGLDVIIDVKDYEEALMPAEVKPFTLATGEDEGYSTEQRPERTASLLVV